MAGLSFFDACIIVFGLTAFEVVSSLDNAVVNAQVLSTMRNERAKRFFLTWGIFFAVFLVRGLLPLGIVLLAAPSLGLGGALSAIGSSDPSVTAIIEAAAPLLMLGGGMFLALLFLHWLFMEDKEFGIPFESHALRYGAVWFYAAASVLLVAVLWTLAGTADAPHLMLAAAIGFAAFFITDGFKQNAEAVEERMLAEGSKSAMGDWSKVFFLEILDLTFSIDGVVGAFAFTTFVPLILIGNGIGAIVVRQLTVANVERIRRYAYLKNGAMYSIGILGAVMLAEGFGAHVPVLLSPLLTIGIIAYFLWLSVRRNRK